MTQQMTIVDVLNQVEVSFNELADTHKQVVWKEECEFALQSVNKNLKLQQCYPESIQTAIKNVAAVGLTLNQAHQFAYLVPESKKFGSNWVQECQLRISFQGFVKLATDSGAIKWAKAEIVKKNDTFQYKGVSSEPVHEFNPFTERGDPIGVYSVAKTPDGDYLTDFMSWEDVEKIKAKAKTQNVWNEWTEEMAKKAMLKRAYKQWPKTNERDNRLATAVQVMNEYEGSYDENYTPDQLQKYQQYLESGTPIEFNGFLDSLTEEAVISLFSSGEKGQKMAHKKEHNEKNRIGREDVLYRVSLLNSGDDEQMEDAIGGLNDLEIMIVKKAANKL
jgi:phage RecT family recombinase